jgi:hypothetical protein
MYLTNVEEGVILAILGDSSSCWLAIPVPRASDGL